MQPIEVVTSVQRRRRFSAEEKRALVEEVEQSGSSISAVARVCLHTHQPVRHFRARCVHFLPCLPAVLGDDHDALVPHAHRALCIPRRDVLQVVSGGSGLLLPALAVVIAPDDLSETSGRPDDVLLGRQYAVEMIPPLDRRQLDALPVRLGLDEERGPQQPHDDHEGHGRQDDPEHPVSDTAQEILPIRSCVAFRKSADLPVGLQGGTNGWRGSWYAHPPNLLVGRPTFKKIHRQQTITVTSTAICEASSRRLPSGRLLLCNTAFVKCNIFFVFRARKFKYMFPDD